MKMLVLILCLILPSLVSASESHRAGQEFRPSKAKLLKARSCWREAKLSGCPHPRSGTQNFKSCLDESERNLSPECRVFFVRLYGAPAAKSE